MEAEMWGSPIRDDSMVEGKRGKFGIWNLEFGIKREWGQIKKPGVFCRAVILI